jgi:hypothetical protein
MPSLASMVAKAKKPGKRKPKPEPPLPPAKAYRWKAHELQRVVRS